MVMRESYLLDAPEVKRSQLHRRLHVVKHDDDFFPSDVEDDDDDDNDVWQNNNNNSNKMTETCRIRFSHSLKYVVRNQSARVLKHLSCSGIHYYTS